MRASSPRSRLSSLSLAFALASSLVLGGCGAGLITGIASTGGGNGGATPPPELSVPADLTLPLRPDAGKTHTVVVTNARLGASANLLVRLAAAGVVVDQPQPTAAVQGDGTAITFAVDTAPIVAAAGVAADLPAELSVWSEGRKVGSSAPVLLVRPPRASLQLPAGATERFLSPLGEQVVLRVDGLRSVDPGAVDVLVDTPDPARGGFVSVQRLAAQVTLATAEDGTPTVAAVVPGNAFPGPVQLRVRDRLAGTSEPVTNAWYRPDIALALPGQGPTTGGSLVTLIGTALVPHDFVGGVSPAPFDFGAVRLTFEKGGRVTELPPDDLRAASSGADRLVFTMPPSPDGRPGQVDIVLHVDLGATEARVVASREFLFANPDPFFGPRGAVLDRLPVAVAAIPLDGAVVGGGANSAAPDIAALTEQGGVGFLQLLLAQQNGMFQRFAAPVRIGDPEVAAERQPRDLGVGDFDGDGVPDLFVVNAGAGIAVHHLVLGQAAPLPPLGAVHRCTAPAGSWRVHVARCDGDLLPDLVLVPGPGAAPTQRPHVLLARPTAVGAPAFTAPAPIDVRAMAYEASELADVDGDGFVDFVVVSGTAGQLDVAYGLGDGSFGTGVTLDFEVPTYTRDPVSPAAGLHACADGALQSLALVLAGRPGDLGGGPTPPTITVLRQTAARQFAAPSAQDTYSPPTEPIGRSLAADLDGVPPIELLVAMRDEPQLLSLGLLRISSSGVEPILEAIEGGAESPKQIRAALFGTAFPATATAGEAKAVFLVHETEVDSVREKRLSTRLVAAAAETPVLLLLPPDAGARIEDPVQGLVGGDFHAISVAGGGAVRDLAVARPADPAANLDEAILLVANDGFGGFPRRGQSMVHPGMLGASLTLLPSPNGAVDGLLFADAASRIGCWRHDEGGAEEQAPTSLTTPLRLVGGEPELAAAALLPSSRFAGADVAGDGVLDMTALLHFDVGSGTVARLALLRGVANAAVEQFPFHLPSELVPVPANASGFVLGDFAAAGAGAAATLELALAVPFAGASGLDGNHVRFYRRSAGPTPADDRFVPAAVAAGPQVLLAGSNPTELAAADFDRDGRVDLLVACRGDTSLRLFRNTSAVGSDGAVAVGDFAEALGSPLPAAVGVPTRVLLADVNGAGSDAVGAAVEDIAGSGERSTSVARDLGTGAGEFTGPRFASPQRLGDRDSHLSLDVGDWNRDGVPDLFLGWATSGDADINLRVLFGGTR
ncbi:MAG: FG-GAP repeat domain-containing protein [Planctomycetota bacterium]